MVQNNEAPVELATSANTIGFIIVKPANMTRRSNPMTPTRAPIRQTISKPT